MSGFDSSKNLREPLWGDYLTPGGHDNVTQECPDDPAARAFAVALMASVETSFADGFRVLSPTGAVVASWPDA